MFKDRSLSYIQVNVPIAFLPNGVSLVDTPGLGALYKSHEWITQNYVSNASALLFVLDPERPIDVQEKKFILRALEVTKDILFVMTKIDMYTPETLSSIWQRDEAILADIFSEKGLSMPQIMPVSSLGLLKASTGKVQALNQINLRSSKFPEVKNELIKMMYKGVGILRTGLALNESANFVSKIQTIADNMLSVCNSDNDKEQMQIRQQMQEDLERLRREWGQASSLRQQNINEIGNICGSIHNRISKIVSANGPIYKEYEAKINVLTTPEEAEELGKRMGQEIVNDVDSQWKSIAQQAECRVAAILSNVNTQIGSIGTTIIGSKAESLELRELSTIELFSCWRGAALFGGVSASLAAAAGVFAVPVIGPIIGVAIGLLTWVFGRGKTKHDQMQRIKGDFRQKLIELLNNLSAKLLHAEENNSRSVVDQFVYELDSNAKNAMQNAFESRERQIQNDKENIERQAKSEIEDRRRNKIYWEQVNETLRTIQSELNVLISMRNQIEVALKS